MTVSILQTHRIDTAAASLVFAWRDGIPEIIYFGHRLDDALDLHYMAQCHKRPQGYASLDEIAPLSMQPELSRGFMGHQGLIGYRLDGASDHWAGRFIFDDKTPLDHGVVFHCHDDERALTLEITCQFEPKSSVLQLSSKLTNTGNTPFLIDWISAPVLPLAQTFDEYMHFHGRWCGEFDIDRQKIPMGTALFENRRGRTSHENFPGIILLNNTTSEEAGPCLGVHLAWSGNHKTVLERMTTGDGQLQMGCLNLTQEGLLQAGKSLQTPQLYMAYSDQGLNAMSQKFHSFIRSDIVDFPAPKQPRPVSVNTWEALYFDHDMTRLKALADAACDIGAERYVLDDGWFEGRNDDTSSLGDWYPDALKYPKGLHPIVDYVIDEKNMAFGLWVEPEMINPKSALYQAHPDWVLHLSPNPLITGRNQLVLNLSNPQVSAYLYDHLSKLLTEYRISYLKWDMNRNLVLPADQDGRASAHRQTFALYHLIDKLRAAFPHVEIESCASGGGRIDFEILKRTHRVWTSDSNDAVERVRIQKGFSYFFPPEIMGAHIGPTWCHTTGRGFHADFRALVASYGHMGLELDLTNLPQEDLSTFKQAVERYKQDRAIWHEGLFYRIATVDEHLTGVLAVSPDKKSARLVMQQIDRPRSVAPPPIIISGLEPEYTYRINLQTPLETALKASQFFDNPLAQGQITVKGSVLNTMGLQLPVLYAQTGLALALEAV